MGAWRGGAALMRARVLLSLAAWGLAVLGCEVVTGLSDLEFQPERCEPDPVTTTCASAECGSVIDNCGNTVACDDRCEVPYACGVGGVDPNTCGCTGGVFITPATPAECSLAETIEGRSYYYCNPLPWDDAQQFCRSFGTDLVVIEDAAENAYVQNRMLGKSWLGLRASPPCDPNLGCPFSWVNGVLLDAAAYQNWNAGEPNNQGGGELCVEILEEVGLVGRWNDVSCTNVLNVICETTCPDG